MEDNFSKRTILLLFAILLASFLFIYKGFFLKGSNYLEELTQYRQSIYSINQSNNKTSMTPQSTLKRSKLSIIDNNKGGEGTNRTKSKIPQELSSIDDNILQLKALMLNLNDKHDNVFKSLSQIHQSNKSIDDLNGVIKELEYMKEQQMRIEGDIDDLALNVDKLRQHF